MVYEGILTNKIILPLTFFAGLAGGAWGAKKIPEYVNSAAEKLARSTAQQVVAQMQQAAYQTTEQQQMYTILNELRGLPARIDRIERQLKNYKKKAA